MAGLRDIIVHQYFGNELGVIWKVIQNDLLGLGEQVHGVLSELE